MVGFVATVDADEVSARVPPDRAGSLRFAVEKCLDEGLGLAPGETIPLPICLEAEALGVSPAPSLELFIELEGRGWNPSNRTYRPTSRSSSGKC